MKFIMPFFKIKEQIKQDDYLFRIYHLLKQMIVLLTIFEISRFVFLISNINYFHPLQKINIFQVFLHGIHFDISAIIKLNCLYIILFLIPNTRLINNRYYRILLNTFFIVLNSLAVFLNTIDIEYFKYANKRITYELFYYYNTMGIEFIKLLPFYLLQYWYLFIFFLVAIIVIYKIRISNKNIFSKKLSGIKKAILLITFFLFIAFITRGWKGSSLNSNGIKQFIPIEYGTLVTNTPFVIIEYYLEDRHINNPSCLDSDNMINLEKNYNPTDNVKKQNVVVIILEGFSKEYIGCLNNNAGYTPFLDSLIEQSLVCKNAYANGRTTLEALPAILYSLPTLGESPIALSLDRLRNFNSLPKLLNSEGYSSSFFYGARNGNLGINNFAREAEFNKYYGKHEYGSTNEDSPWGIFDDDFFKFFLSKIDSFQQPFFSCLLTLSSHSPFSIPQKFQNKFSNISNIHLRSVSYTDYCLQDFFQKASKKNWFNNTLFVIVADHTSYSYSNKYRSKSGLFSIPIIYFSPTDPKIKGNFDLVSQQCDIMPTILNYLNYEKKFLSFGNSILAKNSDHFAVMKLYNQYQYIDESSLINLDSDFQLLHAYNPKKDKLTLDDISNSSKHNFNFEMNKLISLINNYKLISQPYENEN